MGIWVCRTDVTHQLCVNICSIHRLWAAQSPPALVWGSSDHRKWRCGAEISTEASDRQTPSGGIGLFKPLLNGRDRSWGRKLKGVPVTYSFNWPSDRAWTCFRPWFPVQILSNKDRNPSKHTLTRRGLSPPSGTDSNYTVDLLMMPQPPSHSCCCNLLRNYANLPFRTVSDQSLLADLKRITTDAPVATDTDRKPLVRDSAGRDRSELQVEHCSADVCDISHFL